MTINVKFRGPCLFVRDDDSVDEVLLPDGNRSIYAGGQPDTHADISKAVVHYAGMLVPGAGGRDRRIALHRKIVTVRESAGGPCTPRQTFRTVVPVSRLSNGKDVTRHLKLLSRKDSNYWFRVAARVHLEGGEIGTERDSGIVFHFPKDHNTDVPAPQLIPLVATWSPKVSKAATIVITDAESNTVDETIELMDGQTAWIYNFDLATPSVADLERSEHPCKGVAKALEDNDFKWLYQLLVPPNRDWKQWLAGGKKLPAPLSECPAKSTESSRVAERVGDPTAPRPLSPDVASCFFGSWP